MATSAEVYAALRVIGASCRGVGSGENWATEVANTWASELGHATGEHVMDAARVWIRNEDRRPSLHQFGLVVTKARGESVLQDKIPGCPDCALSGWRTIAVHWFEARTSQRRSCTYRSPCECGLGLHYARSLDGFTYTKAIRQFERMDGFIELYCTDRDRIALPLQLRVSPYQYEQHKKRPMRRVLDFGGE